MNPQRSSQVYIGSWIVLSVSLWTVILISACATPRDSRPPTSAATEREQGHDICVDASALTLEYKGLVLPTEAQQFFDLVRKHEIPKEEDAERQISRAKAWYASDEEDLASWMAVIYYFPECDKACAYTMLLFRASPEWHRAILANYGASQDPEVLLWVEEANRRLCRWDTWTRELEHKDNSRAARRP